MQVGTHIREGMPHDIAVRHERCLRRRGMLSSNLRVDNGILAIQRAHGCWFTTLDNRHILDMAAATLCLPFGYGYPPLGCEIARQYDEVSYNSSRFPSEVYLEAAEAILGIAPPGLTAINHKLSNGSDAIEAALKIARKSTSHDTIITAYLSHHGESGETISASGKLFAGKRAMGGSQYFRYVPPHYCKRCFWDSSPDHCHLECAKHISQILRYEEGSIAGILLEPVNVNRGVLVSSRTGDFLSAVREISNQSQVPLIFDEIQSFPWVPGHFFANYFKVPPDLMAVAKGIAGGMPLAALLMDQRFADVLDYNEAEFTWGGYSLSCAASVKTIQIVKSTDFHIEEKGYLLEKELQALQRIHPVIWDVRRIGLIVALEFAKPTGEPSQEICEQVYRTSLKLGVAFRQSSHCLLIKPPLIVSGDEIEFAVGILARALDIVTRGTAGP